MYKLQPIALMVAGENTYLVRFKRDSDEVEYTFTVYDEPFLCIEAEIAFAEITNGDPAAEILKKAIMEFHEARHFQYESEESGSGAA